MKNRDSTNKMENSVLENSASEKDNVIITYNFLSFQCSPVSNRANANIEYIYRERTIRLEYRNDLVSQDW